MNRFNRPITQVLPWSIALIAVVAAVLFGMVRRDGTSLPTPSGVASDAEHDHSHDHAGHQEINSIELTSQARKNIGLVTGKVALKDFERTIAIPGMVVERRGRSKITITAPLTGVVARIYHTEGEAVLPGEDLFELRLTHEELVQSQADLLRFTEELVVTERDIARLEEAGGSIAGKVLIERQHEKHKQEAMIRAQKQALMLHGLSEDQVEAIAKTHELLQFLTVRVPKPSAGAESQESDVLQVQEILVERGQQATAGETLAVLSDHNELLVEGEAFEQDASTITAALQKNQTVSVELEVKGEKPVVIDGLKLLYQTNRVEPTSRTLHFYAVLPNSLVRDTGKADSHRFIDWLYKPGQRVTIRVPAETWKDRIVLPLQAIAQDGIETYVFQANGDHFDRRPVHVEYRDRNSVVIANDGSVFPGDVLALSGAPQLQMAIKNKSGGGIDPHAGHQH